MDLLIAWPQIKKGKFILGEMETASNLDMEKKLMKSNPNKSKLWITHSSLIYHVQEVKNTPSVWVSITLEICIHGEPDIKENSVISRNGIIQTLLTNRCLKKLIYHIKLKHVPQEEFIQ